MMMGLNQILLYGGGIASGVAVIAAIVSFFIMRLKRERLARTLDKEYGEK